MIDVIAGIESRHESREINNELKREEELHKEETKKQKAIREEINEPHSIYFWGDAQNIMEAISESPSGSEFEKKLGALVLSRKGDDVLELIKQESITYWTNWLTGNI